MAGNRPMTQITLLAAGHFLSDFYANFLPALLPIVIASLHLSLTAGGLMVTVFSVASSVIQPICGYYLDRSAMTLPILLTLPISAFFICTIQSVNSYALLLLFLLLSGLGNSVFHPLATAMLSRVTPENRKGLAISIFMGGGNLGFAVAPAVIIYFLLTFGLEQLPYLMIPGILLTFLYYFSGLHHIPLEKATQVARSSGPAWYRSIPLLKLNLVMGLRAWPQVAIPTFLPLYLLQQGQPATMSGQLITVFLLGGAAGGLAGGYFGDKYGRKRIVLLLLALCIPSTYFFITSGDLTIWTWLALFLSGATLQGPTTASIVWAQNLIPEYGAMASGMMLGLSFGLGGLGTALTGVLADHFGLFPALLGTLIPLILALLGTVSIPEKAPSHHILAERSLAK